MTRKAITRQHGVDRPFCWSPSLSRRDRPDNRLSFRPADDGLGKFIPGTVAGVGDMADAMKIAYGQLVERSSQIVGISRAASLVGDNFQHRPLVRQLHDRLDEIPALMTEQPGGPHHETIGAEGQDGLLA